MVLPVECSPDIETCCSDLYDIAYNLLIGVYDALSRCVAGNGECVSSLLAYITMGQGDDAIADSLCVEFDNVAPSSTSLVGSRQLPLMIQRATFTVRLRETGWPMVDVKRKTITAPPPVEQSNAARHAFAHGEAMYRKLLSMHAKRTIVPSNVRGCQNTIIGALQPMRPDTGRIGFFVPVTVSVPWGGGGG